MFHVSRCLLKKITIHSAFQRSVKETVRDNGHIRILCKSIVALHTNSKNQHSATNFQTGTNRALEIPDA